MTQSRKRRPSESLVVNETDDLINRAYDWQPSNFENEFYLSVRTYRIYF